MRRGYPDGFINRVISKIGSEEYRSLDEYDGRFACAIFVSGVLKDFRLIHHQHDKVQVVIHGLSLVDHVVGKDHFKWKEIELKDIKPGDLIVYERKKKYACYHIGIYIGDDEVVSNSWKSRTPIKHSIDSPTLGMVKRKREIAQVFALLKEE